MEQSRRNWLKTMAAPAALAATGTTALAQNANGYRITYDDFATGLAVTNTFGTPGAKWFYFSAGPFLGNDGIVTTNNRGLSVKAGATNPRTNQPAFSLGMGQEGSPENPFSLPGGLDHVKWLVYMNHASSAGFPGFDAIDGQELSVEGWIGGQTYGTKGHPFGSAVKDAEDDLRLAAFAFNSIDLETLMVFDFFVTNKRVYAFYERLPFARGPQFGNYAAFSYAVPVAEYEPGDTVNLKISYNRRAGIVRWSVDGDEVLRIDRIGRRFDRKFMTLDHGGDEVDISPRQISSGMGLFTLMDAYLPSKQSLVKLSTSPNFYFDPSVGAPTPATFVDPASQRSSRLFGQGAALQLKKVVVSSTRL